MLNKDLIENIRLGRISLEEAQEIQSRRQKRDEKISGFVPSLGKVKYSKHPKRYRKPPKMDRRERFNKYNREYVGTKKIVENVEILREIEGFLNDIDREINEF